MGWHDVLEVMERLRKYTTTFYSTHILDDVQRVSDTVAILNKGELVAQAPIEELLAGSDGVTYQLKLDSGADCVRNIFQAQPATNWARSLTRARCRRILTVASDTPRISAIWDPSGHPDRAARSPPGSYRIVPRGNAAHRRSYRSAR